MDRQRLIEMMSCEVRIEYRGIMKVVIIRRRELPLISSLMSIVEGEYSPKMNDFLLIPGRYGAN